MRVVNCASCAVRAIPARWPARVFLLQPICRDLPVAVQHDLVRRDPSRQTRIYAAQPPAMPAADVQGDPSHAMRRAPCSSHRHALNPHPLLSRRLLESSVRLLMQPHRVHAGWLLVVLPGLPSVLTTRRGGAGGSERSSRALSAVACGPGHDVLLQLEVLGLKARGPARTPALGRSLPRSPCPHSRRELGGAVPSTLTACGQTGAPGTSLLTLDLRDGSLRDPRLVALCCGEPPQGR